MIAKFVLAHSARYENRALPQIIADIEAVRSHDDRYCNAVRQS